MGELDRQRLKAIVEQSLEKKKEERTSDVWLMLIVGPVLGFLIGILV